MAFAICFDSTKILGNRDGAGRRLFVPAGTCRAQQGRSRPTVLANSLTAKGLVTLNAKSQISRTLIFGSGSVCLGGRKTINHRGHEGSRRPVSTVSFV